MIISHSANRPSRSLNNQLLERTLEDMQKASRIALSLVRVRVRVRGNTSGLSDSVVLGAHAWYAGGGYRACECKDSVVLGAHACWLEGGNSIADGGWVLVGYASSSSCTVVHRRAWPCAGRSYKVSEPSS